MTNATENNDDGVAIENSAGFREGVMAVLCFVTPIVVVALAVALYFIR